MLFIEFLNQIFSCIFSVVYDMLSWLLVLFTILVVLALYDYVDRWLDRGKRENLLYDKIRMLGEELWSKLKKM